LIVFRFPIDAKEFGRVAVAISFTSKQMLAAHNPHIGAKGKVGPPDDWRQ